MRIIIAMAILLALLAPLTWQPAYSARCVGADPCRACSNCSRCKYCNAGGTCGVCKPKSDGFMQAACHEVADAYEFGEVRNVLGGRFGIQIYTSPENEPAMDVSLTPNSTDPIRVKRLSVTEWKDFAAKFDAAVAAQDGIQPGERKDFQLENGLGMIALNLNRKHGLVWHVMFFLPNSRNVHSGYLFQAPQLQDMVDLMKQANDRFEASLGAKVPH